MNRFDSYQNRLSHLREGMVRACDCTELLVRWIRSDINKMNGLSPAAEIATMKSHLDRLDREWNRLNMSVEHYSDRATRFEEDTEELMRFEAALYPPQSRRHKKLNRTSARHKNRCHGLAKDGPCLGPCWKETAFCYHHQDQAGPTVTGMSDLVGRLAGTLKPGGSADV